MTVPDFISSFSTALADPLPHEKEAALRNLKSDTSEYFAELEHKFKPRICAVAVVFCVKNGELMIPMMQRPDDGHVHGGQISFPGGGKEPTDTSLLETARRETLEEIGLDISADRELGKLSRIYIPPSNSLVTPYVFFRSETENVYRPDPKEVAAVLEINLSDLEVDHGKEFKEYKMPDGKSLKMPVYRPAGHNIWGATARILSELIEISEKPTK